MYILDEFGKDKRKIKEEQKRSKHSKNHHCHAFKYQAYSMSP